MPYFVVGHVGYIRNSDNAAEAPLVKSVEASTVNWSWCVSTITRTGKIVQPNLGLQTDWGMDSLHADACQLKPPADVSLAPSGNVNAGTKDLQPPPRSPEHEPRCVILLDG